MDSLSLSWIAISEGGSGDVGKLVEYVLRNAQKMSAAISL